MKNPRAAPTLAHNDEVSWFAIGAGPFAVALHQVGNYVLVDVACRKGPHLPLHIVSALSLIVALSGALVAWRDWAHHPGRLDGHDMSGRSRFIALVALLFGLLCALVIAAQAIAEFYFDPCQR